MSVSTDNDKVLVQLAQAGDSHSFDELVILYQPKIQQLIARSINDRSQALDLSQEVFIKAFRSLPNFKGESSFYTWLYRIAVNTIKNYIRSDSRAKFIYNLDYEQPNLFPTYYRVKDYGSPELWLRCDELQVIIEDALAELPLEIQQSVILRELDGLTYTEIAEVMSCPLGTVRSRIFRGRAAVDSRVKRLIDTGRN